MLLPRGILAGGQLVIVVGDAFYVLNGTVDSYDCKALVYYTENALKPGDRLTFTPEKQ